MVSTRSSRPLSSFLPRLASADCYWVSVAGTTLKRKADFMLRQLTRFILPLAVMLALAFLLKGHNAPGGGFVSGLSFAVAAILAFATYGTRVFQGADSA